MWACCCLWACCCSAWSSADRSRGAGACASCGPLSSCSAPAACCPRGTWCTTVASAASEPGAALLGSSSMGAEPDGGKAAWGELTADEGPRSSPAAAFHSRPPPPLPCCSSGWCSAAACASWLGSVGNSKAVKHLTPFTCARTARPQSFVSSTAAAAVAWAVERRLLTKACW